MWNKVRAVVWFFVIVAVTGWIWDCFQSTISPGLVWITLPAIEFAKWSFALKIPPLPFYPAAIFFVSAIRSRPPYFWRTPIHWVFSIRKVPKAERRKTKILGRIIFVRFGLFRENPDRLRFYRLRNLCYAGSIVVFTFFVVSLQRGIIADCHQELADVLAFKPPISTRVYDSAGREEICRFSMEDRDYISIDEIPQIVRRAVVAAEDQRFYEHDGVDPIAIIRAARNNYENDQIKQGGSTITQQVIKLKVIKSNEKTKTRKIREVFLATKLEKMASKDKILEIYLNHVYLGRAYGIKAAAMAYYGKNVKDLTIGEAAFLAGMPKAPSNFSPSMNFVRGKERQTYVLGRMREQGFITETERQTAIHEATVVINNQRPLNRTSAPYFCEYLRQQLEREYGQDLMYKKGMVVYTTLNMKMQRAAEATVQNGLVDLERRLGFNGPEGHDEAFTGTCDSFDEDVEDGSFENAQVISNAGDKILVCARGNIFPVYADDVTQIAKWEKTNRQLITGDNMTVRIITVAEKVSKKETRQVRYAISARRTSGANNNEVLQAAMVVVDPKTGALLALIGGYDYNENQFNMAIQAKRQPGSSVKMYFYLTALMRGKTVTDIVNDHAVCYPSSSGIWCPTNYIGPGTKNQYMGAVDLRAALAKSLNSISVQLLHEVGVDEGIRTMRRLGITSPIERVLPIAVGAIDITPWEHTYGYATVAAQGRKMPHQCYHPGQKVCAANSGVFILKVLNADNGEVIYEYVPPKPEQAVPAADAYTMTYLMEGVVQSGTGRKAQELQRPVAGKTGTTNDFKDAWFMGFTSDMVVGVWVGRQRPITIANEATGGTVALPIWLAFMKEAHPDTPPREFPIPNDIIFVAGMNDKLIPYRRGTVPAKNLNNTTTLIVHESTEF